MKIAIDARMYQESGIGRYIRNLIKQLQALDQKNDYYILLKKEGFKTLNFSESFHKVLADFSWYGITEQIGLPRILNSLNLDLAHFPHFNVPLFYKGKFVVTIHDLIHQHYQMRRVTTHDPIIYKLKQLGYKKVFKNALLKSAKILVPSNDVKELLVDEWKIAEEKIVITPEAVDDKIFSAANIMETDRINQVMKKFNIDCQYIFYVGNAHPHKNVEGLIKAFLELSKDYPGLQLVLSGNDHYFWQKVKREYQQANIVYTGFVTDEELVALYKNAKCFVMPSFEEGFGIPLLEAMACGCPVVSSNAGSLPEIGDKAAIYFDPKRAEDMTQKIEQVLKNVRLRQELIKKGRERVKQFSWKNLAKQTLEVYYQCV